MGLNEEGKSKDPNEDVDKIADKIKKVTDKLARDYDVNPSNFYVFSRDGMRVDVGLMIQRPPIFMTMRPRDVEYFKYKNDIMNEYYCNTKQFTEEFEEMARLNEDVLGDNPYSSKMNLDNYPTHKIKDPSTGADIEYCAASKYYANVDPMLDDRRTIHYAPEDRTYLILRNRYTKEWEFPTGKLFFGQTFIRGKQNLFNDISDGLWKIKYFGNSPIVATLREFTEAEKQDPLNSSLKGVRTFFFTAHHWRGLTQMNYDKNEYDDFSWVPKRQLNEYFSRDYFDVFAKACSTR